MSAKRSVNHNISPWNQPHNPVVWLVLAVLMIGTAQAEKADKDKPMNVEAEQVTMDDIKKISIFTGTVNLTQGTITIKANRIVVTQDVQEFQYASVYGSPVFFRQKREGLDEWVEGYADRIEYNNKDEIVKFIGNARMKRGEDEMRGSQITYNSTTEFFQVLGGGRDQATANNPNGRVRATILPKKKKDDVTPPAPAGADLKPSGRIAAPRPD